MHLAWSWFTGLGFDEEGPHLSTFSKNRHGRFQESKLFEEIVARCLAVELVRGDKLSVDGTFVEANASQESRIPREQLTHSQDKVSTTDPDSTYATKGGTHGVLQQLPG